MIHLVPDYRQPGGEALAGLNDDNSLVYSNLYDNDLIGRENSAREPQYLLENGLNQIRQVSNGEGQIIGRQYQHYGPGLTEAELRKLEPEYYAMIDDLENAPDFMFLYNRLRAGAGEIFWYLGVYATTVGQVLSFMPGVGGVLGSMFAHVGNQLRSEALNEIRKIDGMGFVADRYYRPQQWMELYNATAGASRLVKNGLTIYAAYRSGGRIEMWKEVFKKLGKKGTKEAGKYAIDSYIDLQLKPLQNPIADNPLARFVKRVFRPKDIAPPDDEDDADNDDLYDDAGPVPPLPCPPFCPDGRGDDDDDDDDDCPPYCDDDDNSPCPPFCGDGGPPPPGGGGGPSGAGGLDRDPYRDIQRELGGIELSAAAEFNGTPGRFTGAMFDPQTETLVLLGESDRSVPGIKPQDLAVALVLAYGAPPRDAQFSLDPADPQNPQGEWLKAVYLPEDILAGTSFGNTMFEADWLLKQYAFGIEFDENDRKDSRCLNRLLSSRRCGLRQF